MPITIPERQPIPKPKEQTSDEVLQLDWTIQNAERPESPSEARIPIAKEIRRTGFIKQSLSYQALNWLFYVVSRWHAYLDKAIDRLNTDTYFTYENRRVAAVWQLWKQTGLEIPPGAPVERNTDDAPTERTLIDRLNEIESRLKRLEEQRR